MKIYFSLSGCWLWWANPPNFITFGTLGNKLQIFEIIYFTSFVERKWCLVMKKNEKKIVTCYLIFWSRYNLEWIMSCKRYLIFFSALITFNTSICFPDYFVIRACRSPNIRVVVRMGQERVVGSCHFCPKCCWLFQCISMHLQR